MRSPVRALAARASWYRRVGVREPQNRRVEIIIVDGDTLRISRLAIGSTTKLLPGLCRHCRRSPFVASHQKTIGSEAAVQLNGPAIARGAATRASRTVQDAAVRWAVLAMRCRLRSPVVR